MARKVNVSLRLDEDYSESNIRYLEKMMEDYKAGHLHFAEHDLIEAD